MSTSHVSPEAQHRDNADAAVISRRMSAVVRELRTTVLRDPEATVRALAPTSPSPESVPLCRFGPGGDFVRDFTPRI